MEKATLPRPPICGITRSMLLLLLYKHKTPCNFLESVTLSMTLQVCKSRLSQGTFRVNTLHERLFLDVKDAPQPMCSHHFGLENSDRPIYWICHSTHTISIKNSYIRNLMIPHPEKIKCIPKGSFG
ncbi:hypothetical protein H5410_038424 [Solanum commersonii]|uniref:Uncharacterized protein n=1 Tax=Solanum commersonii TaxID=4109 RepID=A0A9J5YC92_SOLCO|nr:hypothetical protein H5410_038424 [Solanum commersonii]